MIPMRSFFQNMGGMKCLFLLTLSVFWPLHSHAQETNWVSLFNGRDLSHWTVKCHPDNANTTFWQVVDGTIEANSLQVKKHDYVWLLSNKQYVDFVLKLKFQAFQNSPGNSGVQIRSRYDEKKYWLDGPQVDINPPGPWRTGMMWDETRENKRWIYPNLPKGEWVNKSMAPQNLKFYYADSTPSWNDMTIEVQGNNVTTTLNGTVVTKLKGEGILNDAVHKKYKVGEKGHVALQIHRNDQLKIRFKDIKIREITHKE